MKRLLLTIALFLTIFSTQAQSLYVKTFGNEHNKPILFIHGGPRGNSVQFEATTAQKLADRGFYVIVYDRRGEGRSSYENAKVTYQEAFDDINSLYEKYKLKKASLIGFSFGGLVTTLYAEKYTEKVQSVVLVSALFSQQDTYNHILDSVKSIYTKNRDTAKLKKVAYVEQLDKNSAVYRGECFSLASENGFFKVPHPDAAATAIYKAYAADALYKDDIRNNKAPELFYKNEKRTNIDVRPILRNLKKKINIYALYGKQDGIFSSSLIQSIQKITSEKNFKFVNNSSHYLYADQQQEFLNSITQWLK